MMRKRLSGKRIEEGALLLQSLMPDMLMQMSLCPIVEARFPGSTSVVPGPICPPAIAPERQSSNLYH